MFSIHCLTIGILACGESTFGDDPDQRPQEKISAAVTEQVKWLIGCLYDSDHIRLKGKAGQSYAEMLGFRIFSR